MKKLTLISIICTNLVFGQLPEANQKVLAYALSQQGHKVGDGICGTLIKASLDNWNSKWKTVYPSHKGIVQYGRKLKSKEVVLPGDILEFDNVVAIDYSAESHGAIVKEVLSNGNIVVLDQNSGDRHGKNNKVDFWVVDRSKIIKGKLIFYRPI